MQRVSFAVTYPPGRAHPIHRRIAGDGPVTRAALLAWAPTATVTTLTRYDAGESAVAELLASVPAVEQSHLVERDGATYAYVSQSSFELDAEVMALVRDATVAFLPPITFEETGTVRFEAVGERASLSRFHGALREALPTRIERVRAYEGRSRPTGLTDRQLAALSAAVDVGYYELPRTGSVADVAAELDCAPSTAGELLRRAERAVVTAAVPDG